MVTPRRINAAGVPVSGDSGSVCGNVQQVFVDLQRPYADPVRTHQSSFTTSFWPSFTSSVQVPGDRDRADDLQWPFSSKLELPEVPSDRDLSGNCFCMATVSRQQPFLYNKRSRVEATSI